MKAPTKFIIYEEDRTKLETAIKVYSPDRIKQFIGLDKMCYGRMKQSWHRVLKKKNNSIYVRINNCNERVRGYKLIIVPTETHGNVIVFQLII